MRKLARRWAAAPVVVVALVACSDQVPTATSPASDPAPSHAGLTGPNATLHLVAQGMNSPLGVTATRDLTGRLLVQDQSGVIWVITLDGTLLPTPFLDLRAKITPLRPGYDERGLLGLALHPQFRANGRLFVYYTIPPQPDTPPGWDHVGRLSEFRAAPGSNVADPSSERVILEWHHPQFNHNGGTVAFGPDGMLYISIGDGGGANDTGLGHVEDWYAGNAGGNAQELEADRLLGNILRLDVDRGTPYAIPPDNPFTGAHGGSDEVWAYGLRNPYRFSFDRVTGMMVVGDAGQNLWEEVDVVVRGGNYGWNVREGRHCFDAESPRTILPEDACPRQTPSGIPLLDPVIEYRNRSNPQGGGLGVTVIGGNVYRGDSVPEFRGDYIFGDFAENAATPSGRVFIAAVTGGVGSNWPFEELHFPQFPGGRLPHYLLGFGDDADRNLYITTRDVLGPTGTTGRVYLLDRFEGTNARAFVANMTGAKEVNAAGQMGVGDPDGTGTARLTLDASTGQVCYELTVQNIAPASAAHIHRGVSTVAGPVVVPLNAPTGGTSAGCTTASMTLIQEILNNPAGFYVNVHNADFPGGAVRGQLEG